MNRFPGGGLELNYRSCTNSCPMQFLEFGHRILYWTDDEDMIYLYNTCLQKLMKSSLTPLAIDKKGAFGRSNGELHAMNVQQFAAAAAAAAASSRIRCYKQPRINTKQMYLEANLF